MVIRLTDRVAVAPQIRPEDCPSIAAQGFTAIINNRPDGETGDQPEGRAVKAAAEAAGLRYAAIPIDHSGFSMPQIEAMIAALDAAPGPVLAFCRSGTRSCNLWALAEAKRGGDPDAIVSAARAGGYEIGGMLPTLTRLAAQA
jgi:uncharacterized protein (TIGR01244 family)